MSEGRPTLAAIFARFLRFGLLAWGGPVAQIAMIKRELVEEEKWISPKRFNRLLAIYQVLPGPEAHELCVHFGMMKRGPLGGVLAGLGFMLPGFLLILTLAWAYQRLDLQMPPIAAILLAVQVAVIALIVRAVHRIGEHALADRWLWLAAGASAIGSWFGVSFWILLPAAGLFYASAAGRRHMLAFAVALLALALALWTIQPDGTNATVARHAAPAGFMALFVSGLKAGLLTFGGAYTAIPFVRQDAVGRAWVSDGQFLDSLALSGIIPAPLIIFATFVGYLAGGLGGALAITAGIFFPAFSFALLFYDRLEQVIEDARLHRLLEGVAAGVVGLIAITAIQLGWNVAQNLPSLILGAAIFVAALALLYLWKSKLNSLAVIVGSAAIGALAF
ncbi:chromate efflux transporter [Sphingomonas sp. RB56-2]|uniref:Chromate efflux transporter n=1 Tax=Sphingomonas brevis TaxID=2908206 RepID=A0ABT0S900_9SPHN|nr:chromate efflux transporter [Sphingomonas brevis]